MITGGRVLYLDFDGVLHPDTVYWRRKKGIVLDGPGHLFEHARTLVDLLAPWPDVRLVLSTSWVPFLKSFSGARRRLPAALQARVVGSTWHSDVRREWDLKCWWEQASRFDTILADVMRRRPQAWIAVDDDVQGWDPALAPHLIATSSSQGLGDPQVQARLAERLVALHQPQAHLGVPLPFGPCQSPVAALPSDRFLKPTAP